MGGKEGRGEASGEKRRKVKEKEWGKVFGEAGEGKGMERECGQGNKNVQFLIREK